jgi:hypothetical protein
MPWKAIYRDFGVETSGRTLAIGLSANVVRAAGDGDGLVENGEGGAHGSLSVPCGGH